MDYGSGEPPPKGGTNGDFPPIADLGVAEIKKFDDAACLRNIKGLFSS
jgi:hypothetical protein